MKMPAKNTLAIVGSKFLSHKMQFSNNRRQANQLVRVLKKSLGSSLTAGFLQELRDNVFFKARNKLGVSEKGCAICLTGLVGREGTTTVSLLLALALGELKTRKILYIDGSFDSDKFTVYKELFNLDRIPVEDCDGLGPGSFYSSFGSNLCFLTFSAMNSLDFFTNPEIDGLFETFRENFDFIVVDMPPLLRSSETKFFAPRSDLLFLVVGPGRSLVVDVERSKECLQELGGEISGVILNRQPVPFWARFWGREMFF